MKKFKKFFTLFFCLPFILSIPSCSKNKQSDTDESTLVFHAQSEVTESQTETAKSEADSTESESDITYRQITAKEAKDIMDTQSNYIIIDARTEEEYAEGHIENAILIPEYEIKDKAEQAIPHKDTLILVYCRSGRRSKIASEALVRLGYTNVYEFGGIIDWQYGIVK